MSKRMKKSASNNIICKQQFVLPQGGCHFFGARARPGPARRARKGGPGPPGRAGGRGGRAVGRAGGQSRYTFTHILGGTLIFYLFFSLFVWPLTKFYIKKVFFKLFYGVFGFLSTKPCRIIRKHSNKLFLDPERAKFDTHCKFGANQTSSGRQVLTAVSSSFFPGKVPFLF